MWCFRHLDLTNIIVIPLWALHPVRVMWYLNDVDPDQESCRQNSDWKMALEECVTEGFRAQPSLSGFHHQLGFGDCFMVNAGARL